MITVHDSRRFMARMETTAYILLIAISFTEALNIHNTKPPILMANESEAARVWFQMESSMQEGIESLIKQYLPTIIRAQGSDDIDISPTCMSDLLRVFNGVRNMKLWAFKLLDSIGKPQSGLLKGTSAFYGSYYECLDVRFPPRETYGRGPVQEQTTGQYCILEFSLPMPPKPKTLNSFGTSAFKITNFKTEIMEELKRISIYLYLAGIRLAVCIPSTCRRDDLNNMLKMVSDQLPVPVYSSIYTCETTYKRYPDQVETGILSFLLALCILVVLATVYEYVLLSAAPHKEHNLPQSLLLAFSMRQTMRKVSEIGPNSKGPLECLNGMRIISTTWVLLGHTYASLSLEPQMWRNLFEGDPRDGYLFQAIANGYFSVETFLLVTSILISYNNVTKVDKGAKSVFSIPIMLLRRFWRVVMPQMLVIAITVLFPIMGSGPLYQDSMVMTSGNCRKTWWKNLLSIQNIDADYYQCLNHSFYVAIDMQLIFIALAYLFILFRNSKLAKIFLVAIGIFSFASTGVVTYIFSYPPTFLTSLVDIKYIFDYLNKLYIASYPYAVCYVVGLGLGTFLARNPEVKISRKWSVIGWISSASMAIFLVYIVYIWNAVRYPTVIESVLYAALQRILWSLSIGWVILACATGNAGPVRSLLSWNGYRPMVRISYMMYLVHFQVLIYYGATRQGLNDPSHTTLVFQFIALLGSSVIVSLILRVLAEGPMLQLDAVFVNWLFGSKKPKQSNEPTEVIKDEN